MTRNPFESSAFLRSILFASAAALCLTFSPCDAQAQAPTSTKAPSSTTLKDHNAVGSASSATPSSYEIGNEYSPTPNPEYQHGPRAGFMRGSKDVQSELALGPGTNIRLYFVDAQWIDIPLTGSSVKLSVLRKGSESAKTDLTCRLERDSYVCALPPGATFGIGDVLDVGFAKEGAAEAPYTFRYTFPFQANE